MGLFWGENQNRLKFDRNLVRFVLSVLLCHIAFMMPPVVASSDNRIEFSVENQSRISLPLYKSGLVRLNVRPKRISVGNPGIADILILKSNQVYVVGKALGSTNVIFWDKNDEIFASMDIEVTHDLESLKAKFHRLLPGENIGVHSAQEKIVLDGQVSSISNLNAALQLAQSYLPECIPVQSGEEEGSSSESACPKGEIINLMSVGGAQQVMLEVKVAEMSRSFIRKLDTDLGIINFGEAFKFGAVNGGASWPNVLTDGALEVPLAIGGPLDGSNPVIGPMVDAISPNTPSISDKGLFLSHLSGDNLFQVALEISRSKGLTKILAEPTLTTLTGRPAQFLSGGEFPVPVPEEDGTTIIFKEFGVEVKFLPTILDQNKINLDLNISVSEINNTNRLLVNSESTSQVLIVPSLTKRSASSTVELINGQTIGIAGLIQDNVSEVMTKLPGLGDIPVLGALFRSQEFISGQSELVIFVTPHLAKPIAKNQIRLPTDSFVPPDDLEFYLFGQMEGRKEKAQSMPARAGLRGGFDGVTFGHQL